MAVRKDHKFMSGQKTKQEAEDVSPDRTRRGNSALSKLNREDRRRATQGQSRMTYEEQSNLVDHKRA